MGRNPHCKLCRKEIVDKTQAIKKSNAWYCNSCYEKLQTEKEAKKTEREKLMDYISKLYDGQIPTFIYVQLAKFRKEYKMKDLGMLLCLKYCFEDLGLKFDNSKGVGIIPYYYTQCANEWKKEQEIKKAIEEFEFNDEEIVVRRKSQDNSYLNKIKSKFTMDEV